MFKKLKNLIHECPDSDTVTKLIKENELLKNQNYRYRRMILLIEEKEDMKHV